MCPLKPEAAGVENFTAQDFINRTLLPISILYPTFNLATTKLNLVVSLRRLYLSPQTATKWVQRTKGLKQTSSAEEQNK